MAYATNGDVQECKKITDHFRGIYKNIPQLNTGKPKDVNMYPLNLQTVGSQLIMPKIVPGHWWEAR
jgi:hypothetical protein